MFWLEEDARRAAAKVGVMGEKGGACEGEIERELLSECEEERSRGGIGDVERVSEGIAVLRLECGREKWWGAESITARRFYGWWLFADSA